MSSQQPMKRYDVDDNGVHYPHSDGDWVKAADVEGVVGELKEACASEHRLYEKERENGEELFYDKTQLQAALAAQSATIAQLQARVIELGGKP